MLSPEVAAGLERRDGLDYFADAEALGLDPAAMRGQALAPYFDRARRAGAAASTSAAATTASCGRTTRRRLADVWLECGHDAMRERPAELAPLLPA